MHDQGAYRAGRPKRLRHAVSEGPIGGTDHLPGELPGMRQRPEDVEHRRDTEFGAHRTHVPHRRMKGAGERKTDTVFGNLGFELLGRDLDVDTDRLEEVEAS